MHEQKMTDREMMERPDLWPICSLLPLQKQIVGKPEPKTGFLAAGMGAKVYIASVFAVPRGELRDVLANVPYDGFASIADVVRAGWIIA